MALRPSNRVTGYRSTRMTSFTITLMMTLKRLIKPPFCSFNVGLEGPSSCWGFPVEARKCFEGTALPPTSYRNFKNTLVPLGLLSFPCLAIE